MQIEAEADKALRRMPRTTARRIRSKLLAMAEDPFARNPTVDQSNQIISVRVIRPRGSAYD